MNSLERVLRRLRVEMFLIGGLYITAIVTGIIAVEKFHQIQASIEALSQDVRDNSETIQGLQKQVDEIRQSGIDVH